MGDALNRAGEPLKARHALTKALGLNAGDFEAWNWMGQIILHEGHPQEAIAPLRSALALVPDDLDTLFALAICYVKLEKVAPAIEVFEQLLRYYPDNVEARENLAKLKSL
jgi:tetratricopeptide (TPR) repeat protein